MVLPPTPPSISAGGGTSGDAASRGGNINIGGLFSTGGQNAKSAEVGPTSILPIVVVGMVLLAGLFIIRR